MRILELAAALAGALLASGCYQPDLGPQGSSPFRCGDGACPRGYRCGQQLCIADGQPDPPLLLGVSSDGTAAPQPVWDGTRFGAFWQQNSAGLAQPPGLHFTSAGTDLTVLSEIGDVAFDVLYHPGAGRHVIALRKNSDQGALLHLVSLAPGESKPMVHFTRSEPTAQAPFGFSAPSVALGPNRGVVLAYTFGAPPALVSDNVFCHRIDLTGGPPSDSCRPSLLQTQRSFASEVAVVTMHEATLLFWRERELHVTPMLRGVELRRVDIPEILHVPRAVARAADVGIVAQVPGPGGGAPVWVVSVGGFAQKEQRQNTSIPTFGMVPDVAVDGPRFVACARDPQGELTLVFLGGGDLFPIGAARRVPRLSRAEITSCRLAAAPGSGAIAVAWQERVYASQFRSYVTVVDEPH